mgnify:CR=1 FL=1
MGYALNQWYVAAYGSEVTGDSILARTVCDVRLALYRTASGDPVALADQCIHRRYPLSKGRVIGDSLQCGYHGLTFDPTGMCTFIPGQDHVPATARVTSYPLIEIDSFVWVWIGDPARAADTYPPRAPWLTDPRYEVVRGMEPLAARYELLVDNLLDLSHETYLHAGYIGTPEVANTPITREVDKEHNIVRVHRHMDDAECPPFYARSTGISGRITRWQDIEYHAPCLYLLHSRVAPQGIYPPASGPDDQAFHVEIVYAITPSTADSTYDFWCVARDFALGDTEVTEFLESNNRIVVMQDVVALNLLEEVLEQDAVGVSEVSFAFDAGALAARKILDKLIKESSSAE